MSKGADGQELVDRLLPSAVELNYGPLAAQTARARPFVNFVPKGLSLRWSHALKLFVDLEFPHVNFVQEFLNLQFLEFHCMPQMDCRWSESSDSHAIG